MHVTLRNKLLALFLLLMFQANAQEPGNKNNTGIAGKVIDSVSALPIEYATITLFSEGNKKPVNGTVTNADGNYKLSGVEPATYKVLIECIGYRPFTFNSVTISKKNGMTDLGSTQLSKITIMMENVTVVANNSLIQHKIDKLVFNAEKDITSQVGVATDILKKIPQVSVDVDGNVELAGSRSIKFLINGKPSTAFGSSIADVLQSIPASQIKSIEVITNPGAKYDAEGLGGIINIILKQSRVKGINGNVSLTAGTLNENGALSINYRKNEFGLNAFVSGNARRAVTVINHTERVTNDTADKENSLLVQDGRSRFKRHGMESGVGFDWAWKKKNNFTGSFRYGKFGSNASGASSQDQTVTNQLNGAVLSHIAFTSHTDNETDFYSTDINLGYIRTFKEDQELEISLDASAEKSTGIASTYQLWRPQDSLFYGINNRNPGLEKEQELQVDYTQPVKEDVILGVGGKISHFVINSNSTVNSFNPVSQVYEYDAPLSNSLEYKQNVFAVYSELSFPVGKIVDAKIGGRYERTEINSFYSDAQVQAGKRGYNTFVPSIFFLHKIGENQTIKLSYSKRIERPDYGDLNPFVNTTDPKNITAGNPNLLPEIGHRYEMSYSRNFDKKGSLMLTAFYRGNEHDIQPFIVFYPSLQVGDSVYTNVNVTARQNIGRENNMGMNAFVDIRPDEKLSLRSNLSFFRRHIINAIDKGYNTNSFNYRFNLNASYQFNPTLAGEFFGNFNSPRNEAQGKYPSFTSYSIALRKQFWNKKGSLALSATNPFALYVNQHTTVFGPNFTVNGLRQIPFRSIGLNFTWKFGKLEFKKDNEPNTDPGQGVEGN
ncbi:MAG: TonB-dependent receptor [Chitinophagaceae bacterium]